MAERDVRIDKAFCVEAGYVCDIFAARDFYFNRPGSLTSPPGKLSFLCSDERCRAKGVRVTGVIHDFVQIVLHLRRRQPFRCTGIVLPTAGRESRKAS